MLVFLCRVIFALLLYVHLSLETIPIALLFTVPNQYNPYYFNETSESGGRLMKKVSHEIR